MPGTLLQWSKAAEPTACIHLSLVVLVTVSLPPPLFFVAQRASLLECSMFLECRKLMTGLYLCSFPNAKSWHGRRWRRMTESGPLERWLPTKTHDRGALGRWFWGGAALPTWYAEPRATRTRQNGYKTNLDWYMHPWHRHCTFYLFPLGAQSPPFGCRVTLVF